MYSAWIYGVKYEGERRVWGGGGGGSGERFIKFRVHWSASLVFMTENKIMIMMPLPVHYVNPGTFLTTQESYCTPLPLNIFLKFAVDSISVIKLYILHL